MTKNVTVRKNIQGRWLVELCSSLSPTIEPIVSWQFEHKLDAIAVGQGLANDHNAKFLV